MKLSLLDCINISKLGVSRLDYRVYFLNGMSSPNVRRLLNNLCARPGTRYLEIGTWRGSTLVSAAINNRGSLMDCVAVDSFSEFEKPLMVNPLIKTLGENDQHTFLQYSRMSPEREARCWLKYFGLIGYVQLINGDCFGKTVTDLLEDRKFNTYFYDGNHDYISQYNGIVKFLEYMDDEFTLVVDDWNDENAERGTRAAIQDLGLTVVEEYVLPARYNGDIEQWWQGLYVARIQK